MLVFKDLDGKLWQISELPEEQASALEDLYGDDEEEQDED